MKFKWNLRVMMAQHDIRSAAELMRQLNDAGVGISSAQTTRIVNEMPSRISTNVLMGLVKIFKCTVNDLIIVEHDASDENHGSNVRKLHGEKKPDPQKQTPATQRKSEPKPVEDITSLTGGRTRAFPIKGRDET